MTTTSTEAFCPASLEPTEEILESTLDFVDPLDKPACPRCSSAEYDYDGEFRAWVCDACGLWQDDEVVDL